MKYCKIIPVIKEINDKTISLCEELSNSGADELLIFDDSKDYETQEKKIDLLKEVAGKIDVDFMVCGNIKRLEDVKKYLYSGAKFIALDLNIESNYEMIKEASDRFGKEKIALYINCKTDIAKLKNIDSNLYDLIIADDCLELLKGVELSKDVLIFVDNAEYEYIKLVCKANNIYGYSTTLRLNIMELKNKLKADGIETFTLESKLKFSDFKTTKFDALDLMPVIVQDYRTDEVLMMAYMSEESFNETIKTGKMTYYSRSRNELWIKGLTSGHFQYLKELRCDCDSDTLLAKVFQIGPACHTGSNSCFFDTIAKKEYKINNPALVLNNVFNTILDRKENPKEGSYTNYLFDKGIDKILKKLGEEATEIVISAKNPNKEEIKYEISDFLYHMMVLMAEREVTWQEIMDELSRRG